jgi:hypothetical protein
MIISGRRALSWTVGLVLVACSPEAQEAPNEWPSVAPARDAVELPSGRDVLLRTAAFMRGHEAFQFESRATYEVVQDSGQKLSFDMWHRLKIRRPDRLFWATLHDHAVTDSVWFFDGEFTLLKQPANVWASVDAPPTIPEAVDRLVNDYGVPVPFADLFTGDPEELWLGDDVTSVEHVGEAYIDGHWTDHVSVRRPGVDFEMWIRSGEEPFPVRLAYRLVDEPGQPSHSARFFGWSTSVSPDEIPRFRPPPGSERIEMVPLAGSQEGLD